MIIVPRVDVDLHKFLGLSLIVSPERKVLTKPPKELFFVDITSALRGEAEGWFIYTMKYLVVVSSLHICVNEFLKNFPRLIKSFPLGLFSSFIKNINQIKRGQL